MPAAPPPMELIEITFHALASDPRNHTFQSFAYSNRQFSITPQFALPPADPAASPQAKKFARPKPVIRLLRRTPRVRVKTPKLPNPSGSSSAHIVRPSITHPDEP